MSTELMIAAQFIMLLLLALIFMGIYSGRLRRNNKQLRAAFDKLKDDLNGVSISTHLEEVEKLTLAACKRESPVYDPSYPPVDQAIALRVTALGAELSVLEHMQRGQVKFEKGLGPYLAVAERITAFIQRDREELKTLLSADFQQRISELQRQVEALQRKYTPMEDNYRKLQLVVDVFSYEDQDRRTRDEMEQMLHNALAKACDGFKDATLVRELVYFYHDIFADRRNGTGPAPVSSNSTEGDGGTGSGLLAIEHFQKIGEILEQQYGMLGDLQARAASVPDEAPREAIERKAIELEDRFNEMRNTLSLLGVEINKAQYSGLAGFDSPEIMQVIDQFTEESAQMVERIHMLSNQNKMLATENEQLRVRLESEGIGEDDSMVQGLKAKLHRQAEEILQLQNNFRDMEAQYLSLYEQSQKSA
jgi:hypothetical protein